MRRKKKLCCLGFLFLYCPFPIKKTGNVWQDFSEAGNCLAASGERKYAILNGSWDSFPDVRALKRFFVLGESFAQRQRAKQGLRAGLLCEAQSDGRPGGAPTTRQAAWD